MNLRQIIVLALQVSILCTVFGLGLKATSADLLYLVRRPGLLARSFLSVFVIMPLVAVAFVRAVDFRPTVKIALVALAICPVPPLLPKKETRAGGHTAFGLGLMAFMALVSIVAVPAMLGLLGRITGRQLAMAPGAVAPVVLKSTLVPLAAGVAFRIVLPAIADRLERPVTLVGNVLLPLAALVLLSATLPVMWALIGDGTVLAMVIFTFVGLAIGHLLGGPNPDHSVVLALSTACRHPALALAIAATNFPRERFEGTILLYLIVNALVGIFYLAWQRRQAAAVKRWT
jgi:BASS family bile acid:Na+ symporter